MPKSELPEFIYNLELNSRHVVDLELDEAGPYRVWTANLTGTDPNTHTEMNLGCARVRLCREARWDGDFYGRLDAVDVDMETIGGAIADQGANADDEVFQAHGVGSGDLLIFERVSVAEYWRKHDLSFQIVEAVAEALAPDSLLALTPMPEGEQTPAAIAKLQAHWARAGFELWREGVFVRSAWMPGVKTDAD